MNKIYGPFIAGRGAAALFFIRFVCGLGMAIHGWGKAHHGYGFHWGDGLNIPPFFQGLATLSELGGGLGLIFGFLSPLSALGVISTMTYAIAAVHLKAGEPFANAEGGPSWEMNALYLIIPLAVLICGPGSWSFDRFLFGRGRTLRQTVV